MHRAARLMHRSMTWCGMVVGLMLFLGAPNSAQAQLLSPGRLARAHESLEGVSNCTQCHELGRPGISNAKCLDCHTTLRTRIQAREGLHSTYGTRSCSSCHKDHFGPDFDILRFDTTGFDHKKAGYELRLAHREVECRNCHKPQLIVDADVRTYGTRHRTLQRTYLGLDKGCMNCHRTDNPHGTQFGTRTCTACHTEETWEKAPLFKHDSARYVLTGLHRTAECASCHKTERLAGSADSVVRYRPIPSQTCRSCHADYHKGAMPQRCEQCHSTDGWRQLRNRSGFESGFDHASTDFQLRGAHAPLDCASCHNPARPATATIRMTWAATERRAMYPAPTATTCTSCHVDAHDGTFANSPSGTNCTACHSESSWLPSSYDLGRHNRESYELTGAHVTVACNQCHQPTRPGGPPQFKLPSRDCASCHKSADPHAGQFENRPCTSCHTTESFGISAFDHSKTRYSLDDTHRNVACAKCHTVTRGPDDVAFTRYRPLETTCRACHGATTPRRP